MDQGTSNSNSNSNSQQSDNRQQVAVAKKQRKQALLTSLIPPTEYATTDYIAPPSSTIKNPYL
jgi:hypothetical protein